MNCKEMQDRLTDYALGALDEARRDELRAHLEMCGDCRAALREIEPTLDLLRDALAAPLAAPERLSADRRARVLAARPTTRAPLVPPKPGEGGRSRATQSRRTGSHEGVWRVLHWVAAEHPALKRAAALILIGAIVIIFLSMPAVVSFSGKREKAMVMANRASEAALSTAVDVYESDTGRLPASLEDLTADDGTENWNGPYVRGGIPKDASGNDFYYAVTDGRPEVRSTSDDAKSLRGSSSESSRRQPDMPAADANGVYVGYRNQETLKGRTSKLSSDLGALANRIEGEDEESGEPAEELVPLEIKLPKPMFTGTPRTVKSDNLPPLDPVVAVPEPVVPSAKPAAAKPAPKPAEFDSITVVKSPVVMRGLHASRSAGGRGGEVAGEKIAVGRDGDEEMNAPVNSVRYLNGNVSGLMAAGAVVDNKDFDSDGLADRWDSTTFSGGSRVALPQGQAKAGAAVAGKGAVFDIGGGMGGGGGAAPVAGSGRTWSFGGEAAQTPDASVADNRRKTSEDPSVVAGPNVAGYSGKKSGDLSVAGGGDPGASLQWQDFGRRFDDNGRVDQRKVDEGEVTAVDTFGVAPVHGKKESQKLGFAVKKRGWLAGAADAISWFSKDAPAAAAESATLAPVQPPLKPVASAKAAPKYRSTVRELPNIDGGAPGGGAGQLFAFSRDDGRDRTTRSATIKPAAPAPAEPALRPVSKADGLVTTESGEKEELFRTVTRPGAGSAAKPGGEDVSYGVAGLRRADAEEGRASGRSRRANARYYWDVQGQQLGEAADDDVKGVAPDRSAPDLGQVPILGDIPMQGRLFREQKKESLKRLPETPASGKNEVVDNYALGLSLSRLEKVAEEDALTHGEIKTKSEGERIEVAKAQHELSTISGTIIDHERERGDITIDELRQKESKGAGQAARKDAKRRDTLNSLAKKNISDKAKDISGLEALKIVSNVANLRYEVDGDKVTLVPKDSPDGPIVQRTYELTPTVGETEAQVDWQGYFSELGVEWPKGSSVHYDSTIGKLIVANTEENIEGFEDTLSMLSVDPAEEPPAPDEPEEEPTGPRFKAVGVNPVVEVPAQPFSTFSIDVDTASYTLGRNYMLGGFLPPAESVRTEEFVNFFDYDYTPPVKRTFAIHVEGAPSKFGRGLQLLKIGVKGRRLGREEERGAVLTILVDSSGSMDTPDRMDLAKKSLRMLAERLGEKDVVSIVQYGNHARVVLANTAATERKTVLAAIDGLQCSGSTNLEEGMHRAYSVAAANFVPGAENRVLVLSDGAANLGAVGAEDILGKVESFRKQGIYCSVFGLGQGTYNDEMLETLANKGDGVYRFIDSEEEARKVFVDDLAATLNTIARDVKIQVEFNGEVVARYRQLGYENRQLKKEDFRNDAVDAGEVGSGQSVTALYELELLPGRGARRMAAAGGDAVCTVRVRYRRTDNGRVEEIEQPFRVSELGRDFNAMDARFRLAACVAESAEILRACPFAAGSEFNDVAEALRPVALQLHLDSRVQELLRLVQGAGGMSRGQ